MRLNHLRAVLFVVLATVFSSGQSFADELTFNATGDTTLYSNAVNNNGGGHGFNVAGIANNGNQRRMLLMFDTSTISAGSTINSARLDFNVLQVGSSGGNFQLFRVDTAWGEGNKAGNQGSGATAGEATWNAATFGSVDWSTPGGSFFAPLLDQTSITSTGTASFDTSVNFTAAVQAMVDNPSQNFGLLVLSNDAGSALRIGSREGGSASSLVVDFTAVPEPTSGIVIGLCVVGLGLRRKRR